MTAVTLREIQDTDAENLVRWRNENVKSFPAQPLLTIESHLKWFHEKYQADPSDRTYMVCCNGRDVGTIGLQADTREVQRVMLGDRAMARTGVMGRALGLVTEGLGHCWLKVLVNNTSATRFYAKHGFRITQIQGIYLIMERGTAAPR